MVGVVEPWLLNANIKWNHLQRKTHVPSQNDIFDVGTSMVNVNLMIVTTGCNK